MSAGEASAGGIELQCLSKRLNEAFNMEQDENKNVALSPGGSSEAKGELDKRELTENNPSSSKGPQRSANKKGSLRIELLDVQNKSNSHATLAEKSPASAKSTKSAKSAKSHSSNTVAKYIRSPGGKFRNKSSPLTFLSSANKKSTDYAFFELDNSSSASGEDEGASDVETSSKKGVAYHIEHADDNANVDKATKSKKKRSRKWLRKYHKRQGSDEVDLLTGFDDTSRPASDKSSESPEKAKGKSSKLDDSCSSPYAHSYLDAIGDCASPASPKGLLSPTKSLTFPAKEHAPKDKPIDTLPNTVSTLYPISLSIHTY